MRKDWVAAGSFQLCKNTELRGDWHWLVRFKLDNETVAALREQDAEASARRAEKEQLDERKKKYNSFSADNDGEVTQEQMEAYMQSKPRWDDPLANMKDTT